ncbi:hypothetical protein [Chryseosolibacter indicus]|uniref:Uncharacterized protein n=1 Tax=Chryseosolibacter indicus TaxID=2782351 RepID=A0ABS5VNE9_9BACT|nr:hypothetical protein [Chryseosolibacter indicus]MBT1702958.1 hypothetical protein [Chryseosolibacter indicus]
MDFNTKDCAWHNITLTLLGRKITGLRGFSFKKSIEKEHVYAAGQEPVDIQEGNKKYEGNLKMLKYELDLLNRAAQKAGFVDITEVPHTAISAIVEYKKTVTSTNEIITGVGMAFTEMDYKGEQNAKYMEVDLPFLAMRIIPISKSNWT